MIANPVWGIWFHPRRTLRQILAEDPRRHIFWLFLLTGVAQSFDRAADSGLGEKLPLPGILLFCFTVGPLMWVGFYWLLAFVVSWTGEWIGGRGTAEQVRAALAWSAVPIALTSALWIGLVALTGKQMFLKDTPMFDDDQNLRTLVVILPGLCAIIGLRVWAFVLTCHALAETQGFKSAWKGLGNLALGGAVLVLPLVALVVTILLLARAA